MSVPIVCVVPSVRVCLCVSVFLSRSVRPVLLIPYTTQLGARFLLSLSPLARPPLSQPWPMHLLRSVRALSRKPAATTRTQCNPHDQHLCQRAAAASWFAFCHLTPAHHHHHHHLLCYCCRRHCAIGGGGGGGESRSKASCCSVCARTI